MSVTKKRSKNPRMCLICRKHDSPSEFIRIVRRPDGVVVLDDSGKVNGRGAYLCPSSRCVRMACRSRRLDKALKTVVPDEIYLNLLKKVEEVESDGDL